MNETITLPQLAELIASVALVTPEDAANFAKAFFAHIGDALVVTDSITIDGLGCFARNSNPENPIKFTPSKDLTSALNQPFAMFTPIAVGDADLSEDTVETTLSESSSQEIYIPVETNSTTTESEQEVQAEAKQSESADNEEDIVASAIEMPIIAPDTPDLANQPDPTNEETPVTSTYEYEDYYPSRRQYGVTWLIILFLLGFIIGGIAVYFGHDKLAILFGPKHSEPVEIEVIDENLAIAADPDAIIIADDATDTIAHEPTEISRPEIYDTVSPTRFLTTMARQYYGPMEYWVFIYEANSDKLGHPNKIKPGTRVIIPDRSTFTNGESDEQIMQRARRKGAEIYSRYE